MVDTGKGIEQSEMGSLFNMFGKLNRTALQNSAGLGMGLKVCKQSVEANGGRISVQSAGADQGCEFTFSFKAQIEQSDKLEHDIDDIFDKGLLGGVRKKMSNDVRDSFSELNISDDENRIRMILPDGSNPEKNFDIDN